MVKVVMFCSSGSFSDFSAKTSCSAFRVRWAVRMGGMQVNLMAGRDKCSRYCVLLRPRWTIKIYKNPF